MMISPLRILMLYRQEGLVQTQALYSIEAPWLPKSESGTRSPSLHLRHRGNAFSTKSPPSFSMEESFRQLHQFTEPNKKKAEGEPQPLHQNPHTWKSLHLFTPHQVHLLTSLATTKNKCFFLHPTEIKVKCRLIYCQRCL